MPELQYRNNELKWSSGMLSAVNAFKLEQRCLILSKNQFYLIIEMELTGADL